MMMDGQRWGFRPLIWIVAIALAGGQSGCRENNVPASSPNPVATEASPLTPKSSTAGMALPPNFVVQVVEKVGPAVVRINSTRTVQEKGGDSPWGRLFETPQQDQNSERVDRGTGSGFIFDKKGLVITNAHVVDKADQVTVLLKDGRQFKGKVLGEDTLTDVAVVKIEASNLPTVSLGNSKKLLPGEWAIAIGNPLGLDNTVTVGIISATGRSGSEIGISDRRVSFIQTDAAINPGNSGGPLLNAAGQVVGVNTAIIQGAQGLGFAIPIDSAQLIAQQLVANGKAEHAFLGVQMVDLTAELRDRLNQQEKLKIDSEKGVLVVKVMPNSPAAAGGIRSGDLVQAINDQPTRTTDDVQQAVETARPGGIIAIKVRQRGELRTLRITLSKLEPQELARDRP
jgi:S1-C subfamily serine protease